MPADPEINNEIKIDRIGFIVQMADWAIREATIIDQPVDSFTRRTQRRSNRTERAELRTDAKRLGVTADDVVIRLTEAAQQHFLSRNLQRQREKLAKTVVVRLFTVPKKHNIR